MFTHNDISVRSIFVVNCISQERKLRVKNGELMLEEIDGDSRKTLTKFPFQKLLALFVIGHITVTTPLIEKCDKHGVALAVLKQTYALYSFGLMLLKQISCCASVSLNLAMMI